MRPLLQVLRHLLAAERGAFLRGAALALAVFLTGAALLGLSGWFITAAAAAGLAGAGAMFDVFRPSALVRLLAFGRTAARYGERVLTHEATLRALAALRVRLLERLAAASFPRLERIRGAQALNALTADVDALDGVTLRLALPVAAAVLAHTLVAAVLWRLAAPAVALWLLGVHLLGGALVLGFGLRAALSPARRAERAAQAFRARCVDLLRAREDLAVAGALGERLAHALAADAHRRTERARIDRIERRAGLALTVLTMLAVAGTLGIGLVRMRLGLMSPAIGAIGPFAALALSETLAPLRRAVAEAGRMADAARRVAPDLAPPPAPDLRPEPPATGRGLAATGLRYRHPGAARPVLDGLSLAVAPGETLALSGPSGSGKSTLLALLAGLVMPEAGEVRLFGAPLADWPEPALRARLALVPQRAALTAGSLRETLALAAPEAGDATLRAALEAVALWPAVAGRGGLDLRLGDRGQGLSGGESRRLALARALLRRPAVLLLDEPTEGIDETTAAAVLAGIRAWLPEAAIVIAAHRPLELAASGRIMRLR